MGKEHTVYSVCGMCGTRCPIAVDVVNDSVQWVYGNPHSSLKGALCARGAAGALLEEDSQRPQSPLLRVGPRGSGQWKSISWDEALHYVAEGLQKVIHSHGPQSILWSDRDGPFADLNRAFMRGIGSPNVATHSATCDLNAHHACKSVFGWGRALHTNDYAHCRHLVLQSRNIFEALNVSEARTVGKALQQGCRLTVIDVRNSITAAKAHTWLCPRPGTDYALNLAILHVLIEENLYDADFVSKNCSGFAELATFVHQYSPQWAAEESGIDATAIVQLAHDLAAAAPHVIWHPGWMTSRYPHSFQVARTSLVITALLGGVGIPGGMVSGSGPKDVGRVPLQSFTDLYPPAPGPRADGVGVKHKAFDPGKGLLHHYFRAMQTGQPYPLKAYIAWRHDPVNSLPDPDVVKKALNSLDLIVNATFSWSMTGWYSDIILPLSPYLSRESIIGCKVGLKPQFFMRQRAISPQYNTRADWEIISGLSKLLGLDKLVFTSPEEMWAYQLKGTGLSLEDFAAKGFVELCTEAHWPNPCVFPTPSGTIELNSASWEAASNVPMLTPYVRPERPPADAFRLIMGRVAVHTQGHTVNNPLLAEQMPENVAWIHPSRATALGLCHGERVEVLNSKGESAGSLALHLTEGIHPEALFLVHGFGHQIPCESRAFGKGVADGKLLCQGLDKEDLGGGGLAMQQHFVTLRKAQS